MSDLRFWLGFSLVPGIGPHRLAELLNHFDSLESAWNAHESKLQQSGLGAKTTAQLVRIRQSINLEDELRRIRSLGINLIPLHHESYPGLLRDIDDPPLLLYVRGHLLEEDRRAIAIVGTRKATKYGLDVSYRLARELAANGITVISGMAQGIDTAAHKGALSTGGRTIAVLGSGVDVIYPRQNETLAQKIIQNGAIISEFPIGTKPLAANFPIRNRIVSGMSLGVMVTEAPENSGALITAGTAAEQGREVFAVPANIFNIIGQGANRLIQDGARLVINVNDILDELNIAHDTRVTRERTNLVVPENDDERLLLSLLEADPIHIDDLARESGLSISQVSSTLTVLELKGLAQMVGHMQYCRTT